MDRVRGSSRSVLVVGDVMMDRSWIVAEPAETSQAHAEISPKKVVDPRLPNVRLGGAGLTAGWLARDPRFEVRLLGQGGSDLRQLLTAARVAFFPELVGGERQTTTKFRIYAERGSRRTPALRQRYDLDVTAEEFTLPELGAPDLVVVADFQKGMVTSRVLEALAKQVGRAAWLVDSKNPAIVSEPFARDLAIRPTLFVNRDEIARIAAQYLDLPREVRRSEAFLGPWNHVEENVLEVAKRFHEARREWDLVVKLDGDGAVAFWLEGERWRGARVTAPVVKDAVGIGAGDAFLAGWGTAVVDGQPMAARLATAAGHASAWLHVTEETRHLVSPAEVPMRDDWSARLGQPWPEPKPKESFEVDDRRRRLADRRTLEALIAGRAIDLALAGGHCGQFMTLDPTVGSTVRHFAAEIKAYFDGPGSRRPLNCLVWAAPGSGKSFLVEEVARHVGAEFVEINVSTLVDRQELKRELEAASKKDAQRVLVMIDECAASIGGEHVFPALLSPLWGKIKTKKIVFVLVDSYPEATNTAEFVSFIRKQEKGPDLASRINGPHISLSAPSRVDRAVLVASLVRRLHSGAVVEIESEALLALVEESPGERWSPRAIEYVIEAVSPSGTCIKYRDLIRVGDLCERMHIRLAGPAAESTVVEIFDSSKRK